MRRGSARLACLVGALMTMSLCATAQAGEPRIINGQRADQGEYPAQGFLELDAPRGPFVCGGTLLSNRHFVTAAHCATFEDSEIELDATAFTVTLGKVDTGQFTPSDEYSVIDNDVNTAYVAGSSPQNDSAILTLSTPAPAAFEPLRLVEPGETSLWQDGRTATIIGWGRTESGFLSDFLLEATAPMRSDAFCDDAWGTAFDPQTMVCAGAESTDTCGGDSGGPLMVSDGAFLILAGLTSWGADPCGAPGVPGVYTRLGAPALNTWVRDRVPLARASASDSTPEPGQPVTFSVTARHPTVPGFFAEFAWDFDSDGITDDTGATVSHSYPAAGRFTARVRATGTGPDVATTKVAVNVATPPPPPVITPPAPTPPVVAPPIATPRTRLATILASGRPQVRRGRFKLRINFAATAPAGIAVIEVFRGKRKIGSGRARVRRGGSRQVSIKLTKTGRRLLRRSESKRLRVRVQVRVKRRVLRSRGLTIRL